MRPTALRASVVLAWRICLVMLAVARVASVPTTVTTVISSTSVNPRERRCARAGVRGEAGVDMGALGLAIMAFTFRRS